MIYDHIWKLLVVLVNYLYMAVFFCFVLLFFLYLQIPLLFPLTYTHFHGTLKRCNCRVYRHILSKLGPIVFILPCNNLPAVLVIYRISFGFNPVGTVGKIDEPSCNTPRLSAFTFQKCPGVKKTLTATTITAPGSQLFVYVCVYTCKVIFLLDCKQDF